MGVWGKGRGETFTKVSPLPFPQPPEALSAAYSPQGTPWLL